MYRKFSAMQNRIDGKLVLLYTLLVLQVFIVMIYVVSTPPAEYETATTKSSVSFVEMETLEMQSQTQSSPQPTYKTINGEFRFRDIKTSDFFINQKNRTTCWREGLDTKKMETFQDTDKCVCKQGWHSADCGQPEVVWRAIMASKQNIKLRRRRAGRRLIYMFSVYDYNLAISEVIVEELYHVVDLFVICDYSNSEDNFRHKLMKGLLRPQQNKILYINLSLKLRKPKRVISKYIWDKIGSTVKNLKEDDIYVTTESEQILNWRALLFLKVYDGWPQPIGFRLRWSVYGFYWQHPSKATITVGACTVGLIYDSFRTNSLILQQKLVGESSERDNLGLVIGDLNHYGGWYCHYCQSPANILNLLQREDKLKLPESSKNIDVASIEDLISTGVWIDGKMSLQRAYKSRDTYFAPETVLANAFKYDWLVENFYAKLDYY